MLYVVKSLKNTFLKLTNAIVLKRANIKTKKVMNKKSAWLWIGRLEAYNMAQIAIKRGAKEVNIEYFGRLKNLVIRDIKEDINKHNYRN